jgi:uncharacterized repeat protein (TIGR01451 family)
MKIFNKIRSLGRKTKLAVAAITLAVAVAVPFAAQAEFFPNRPTFDYNKAGNGNCSDPNNPATKNGRCGSMNGPVFNSFINTPSYGDERAFVDARRSDQTAAGSYKNVLPDVTKGSKEIVVRMYVHNNANKTTNASGLGVAKNTKVRLALPSVEGSELRAVGYISADNATPKVVEDTVDFTSTERFKVSYKPGSAIIYSNGPVNGSKLSDSIVTTGAAIGHTALNGSLPGCFEYEAVVQVTLKVETKGVPHMDIDKKVRKTKEGQTGGWATEVHAKPGDKVDWLLNTKNTSQATLTNVVTRDVLPPHVELVSGSMKFVNKRLGTVPLTNTAPLFGGGYNSGRYEANDNSLITFTTIVKGDFEECQKRVRNVAYAKSKEYPKEIRDDADVVITRENCKPEEKPQYACELLTLKSLGDRKIRLTASASASGGATVKRYIYNFGDGSAPLTTDKTSVEYTYKKDGTFNSSVQVVVEVDGEEKIVTGNNCVASITFKPGQPPVVPKKPTVPTKLPDTGAGDIILAFVAVTVGGTVAYHLVLRRFAGL